MLAYPTTLSAAYTTFELNDLSLKRLTSGTIRAGASGPTVEGGRKDLWDDLVGISVTVTNTGDVAGAEVPQVYVTFPEDAESPPMQLRGFDKVFLEAGESQTVEFALQRRDLSIWSTKCDNWKIPKGEFTVHVGQSSRDISDSKTITLRK